MMIVSDKYYLHLPMLPAENTVAYFWSGINVTNMSNEENYLKYFKFYREQNKIQWNQSS